jgi:hypothetical protein
MIEVVDIEYTPEYCGDMRSLLRSLHKDHVRVLRYRYRELPWTSLAVVAPAGFAFSAFPAFGLGLQCERKWCEGQRREAVVGALKREFRQLGFGREQIPNPWVGSFSRWRVWAPNFSADPLFVQSFAMPRETEEAMIALLQRMHDSLPETGCVRLPLDFRKQRRNDRRLYEPIDYPWELMRNGFAGEYAPTAEGARETVERALFCLKASVAALENGCAPPYDMDWLSASRLTFRLRRASVYATVYPEYFPQWDLCDAYRARLIRLLRRPEQWYMNAENVNRIKESLALRPPVAELPYQIVEELCGYDREVVESYPWLEETPYRMAGVTCPVRTAALPTF